MRFGNVRTANWVNPNLPVNGRSGPRCRYIVPRDGSIVDSNENENLAVKPEPIATARSLVLARIARFVNQACFVNRDRR